MNWPPPFSSTVSAGGHVVQVAPGIGGAPAVIQFEIEASLSGVAAVTRLLALIRIDQHARIQNGSRIQRALGRLPSARKSLRTLLVVPPPMVPTDRVMMGDRSA